jgi:hypothetical protein
MDENVLDLGEMDVIAISERSKNFIMVIAKWSKFLAIVGFVFAGLMAVGAIFMMGVSSSFGGFGAPEAEKGISYLVMAVLYFFPCYYLIKFSSNIKTGIEHSRQNEVDNGFENLKSTFKFMGIMTIIVLSLYILIFILSLIENYLLLNY